MVITGYKWSSHEALYLINRLRNVCNKTTNLPVKTYFPLQNILNMILTTQLTNYVIITYFIVIFWLQTNVTNNDHFLT